MKKNSTDSRKAHAMLTVSRVLVYALLIFLSVLCLFSFYMLIVNASRTNADLQGGFKALPQGHFLENLKNAWNDSSINIPRGMLNSFIIAAATAILSTYFSAQTARENGRNPELFFVYSGAVSASLIFCSDPNRDPNAENQVE